MLLVRTNTRRSTIGFHLTAVSHTVSENGVVSVVNAARSTAKQNHKAKATS